MGSEEPATSAGADAADGTTAGRDAAEEPVEGRKAADDRDEGQDATGIPVAEALASDVAVGETSGEPVPGWLDTAVQYTWRSLVIVVGATAVLFVLTRLYLVSLPIILALILATLCVPPARRLERLGVPRLAAALLVVIGGIGSLVGLGALMTPTFIEQGRELQPSVAQGVDSVLLWLEEGPIGYDRTEVEALFNQALETLQDQAGTIASSVGTIALAIGQGIAALTLAIVLLFFIVKDGEQIVAWFIKLVPDHHSDTVRAAGARGWVALSGFVRGTALVALIDALGIGIGLFLLDIPAYLPLSVLIFFGGFIPVIGATVTGLLAVLVALASGGFSTALIVGGLVLVVQQVESNVLQPTIMRRAVALHPTVILAVLTAGAVLIGVVGAFLAVPLTAVAAAVGNELRLRHEVAKRGGVAGASPIGGPGVDPETVRVQFPADTRLRAAGRRRDGRPRQLRTRKRTRERVAEHETDVAVRPPASGTSPPSDVPHDGIPDDGVRTTPTRSDYADFAARLDTSADDPDHVGADDDDDLALRTADLKIPLRRVSRSRPAAPDTGRPGSDRRSGSSEVPPSADDIDDTDDSGTAGRT